MSDARAPVPAAGGLTETVRALTPDDAPEMRRLFELVFGHSMSPALWAWKYSDGRGHGVGLFRDGAMVAHYGGLTRRLRWCGQRVLACQVCDVVVQSSANRALVRRGPLFQVCTAFLQDQVGTDRPHPVAFGFPSARHHAVAHRLGLYDAVDHIVQLAWPARPASPDRTTPRVHALAESGDFTPGEVAALDRLGLEMADDALGSLIGVRDAEQWRQRYLRHPEVRYGLHLVRSRWWGIPLAAFVVRRHEGRLQLLDVVGARRALPLAVQAAQALAAQHGLPVLDAWITASHAHWLDPCREATRSDPEIPVPCNTWTPGPSAAELQGRWFLMAGDADFT